MRKFVSADDHLSASYSHCRHVSSNICWTSLLTNCFFFVYFTHFTSERSRLLLQSVLKEVKCFKAASVVAVTLSEAQGSCSDTYLKKKRLNVLVLRPSCVSDLTDSSSFQRARFWVKELQNCEEVREPPSTVILVISPGSRDGGRLSF